MIFGGFLSASLALGALLDNFKARTALILAAFPLAALLLYFLSIGQNSFAPFIFLQFTTIGLAITAYSLNFRAPKSVLIYLTCAAFILAGIIQFCDFQFMIFNHNDLFHLISLVSITLLYSAVICTC